MKNLSKAIGVNLRRLRMSHYNFKKVMSQAQLARKAKISQSTIAQIESGQKLPSLTTAYLLAKTLGVGVHDVLPEQDIKKGGK